MNPNFFESLGLNSTQAKIYKYLIENGASKASDISKLTGEKRTTVYMALEIMTSQNIITKEEGSSPATYKANNPTVLEKLLAEKRDDLHKTELNLKQSMPMLLSYFYSFSEVPGVRMFQGVDGLKQIYQETLRAKKDIYLLRTTAESDVMSSSYIKKYREKRAQLGINTYAWSPLTPTARRNIASGEDSRLLFHRNLTNGADYNAPVEINVYGTRVAIAIFGQEVTGFIIDSPAFSEAVKQLLKMLPTNGAK